VLLALRGHRVTKVFKEYRATLDRKDHKVQKVTKAIRVTLAIQDLQDQRELLELQAQKVHRVSKD
jgi:hypothetical protein